jgi:hypothetical protein
MSTLERLTRLAATLPPDKLEIVLECAEACARGQVLTNGEFAERLAGAPEIDLDPEDAALIDVALKDAESWRPLEEIRREVEH